MEHIRPLKNRLKILTKVVKDEKEISLFEHDTSVIIKVRFALDIE